MRTHDDRACAVHEYGDRAVELVLDGEGRDDARRARAIAQALAAAAVPHVRECVSGYGAVLALLDDVTTRDARATAAAIASLVPTLERAAHAPLAPGKTHVVSVVYDGVDLADVARLTGLDVAEVVRRHAARTYEVEVVGFMPGFAYLGGLDPALAVPRLPTPRTRVAAGSVGLADARTAIYPLDSPGGWRLIGRAVACAPFAAAREPPALFAIGDRVSFRPTDAAAVQTHAHVTLERPRGDALVVLAIGPLATVQDRGRVGFASSGVPRSGALDDETMRASLAAVGLPDDAAAIELPFGGARFRSTAAVRCSIDGAPAFSVAAGDEVVIDRGGHAVRYLAIDRSLDVPRVLGSRSTFPTASLGGHHGRALQVSDVIPLGASSIAGAEGRGVSPRTPAPDAIIALDCLPVPEGDPALLDALTRQTFTVDPRSDRVGTRLSGTALPASSTARASRPTMRGAVQLPPDGLPIVLGPDGPTTGGYPVLAVLTREACAALARVRPRGPVRFHLVQTPR